MKGLGTVLLQGGKPVIYVSRTLTPAEERYFNIEREFLGMVFAVESLHNYVYGEPVRVQTDHKPLEMIWNKSIATASPRLKRLLLRLARYEIQIEYICGKDNSIADALSRVDPLSPRPMDSEQMDVIPVHHITSNVPATDNRLDRTRTSFTAGRFRGSNSQNDCNIIGITKLTNQTAGQVISLLKTIFEEYGIPATVYTDQRTQFVSQEFKQFAMQYRFEVQHSSPRYPQSNGFIEAVVKVVKGIMEKAEELGSDPHLAMLIYRATPVRLGQLSPGEMLSMRKYRALLPTHQWLHPNLETSREAQIAQKQAQRDDYDRTAKKLQDVQQFQSVRFQLDPKKPIWQKATVVQQPGGNSPRRYEVQTESGARYFRNRRHTRPAIESHSEELNQVLVIPGTEQKSQRPGLVKHPSSAVADVADQP
ncbi:Retrovirus-related Pol polyprotein [Stylophora pistillata]|uniref:Retrovirus-related Pol polyprotein n=1 Tax=Stylophora pistillata TaxID=50429 RepID=A0A2B4SFC0_STYPI|nr:Retrovirus-related Pol polyprotein [Stylophora pistillata]